MQSNCSSNAPVGNWQTSTCEDFFYDPSIIDFKVAIYMLLIALVSCLVVRNMLYS